MLFEQGKQAASIKYQRTFFVISKTPEFMNDFGLEGKYFTIAYGVISRHFGKDESHTITIEQWELLPEAILTPFAITKYYSDKHHTKPRGFRLYTNLLTTNGFVVVGIDVKRPGKNQVVNAVSTVFARRENGSMTGFEEELYRSETISPRQEALLERPNSSRYLPEGELSNCKYSEKTESAK